METTIEYTDRNKALVSTDEISLKRALLKYSEERKDETEIVAHPDSNDGCLCIWVPTKWIRIKPPKGISDERRAALSEALRDARERKKLNEAV